MIQRRRRGTPGFGVQTPDGVGTRTSGRWRAIHPQTGQIPSNATCQSTGPTPRGNARSAKTAETSPSVTIRVTDPGPVNLDEHSPTRAVVSAGQAIPGRPHQVGPRLRENSGNRQRPSSWSDQRHRYSRSTGKLPTWAGAGDAPPTQSLDAPLPRGVQGPLPGARQAYQSV